MNVSVMSRHQRRQVHPRGSMAKAVMGVCVSEPRREGLGVWRGALRKCLPRAREARDGLWFPQLRTYRRGSGRRLIEKSSQQYVAIRLSEHSLLWMRSDNIGGLPY